MFDYEIPEDRRPNSEVMTKLAKTLRIMNAGRYGLKDRFSANYLVAGTTLARRNLLIGYNNSSQPGNTFIFTGQCLVKDQEDTECPVTIEDALECERLAEILAANPTPCVCIYPDSTYSNFVAGWSGEDVNESVIESCTLNYIRFRERILPQIIHVRTSDHEHEIKRILAELGVDIPSLRSNVRRIYGGRVLKKDASHSLQQSVLEYGVKACLIPRILGRREKYSVTFAEPDEICSVSAAQLFDTAIGSGMDFSLVGHVPLPPVEYDRRNVRMYSAGRDKRIHLNESNSEIRSKLLDNPNFLLLYLYMSPLTTDDQLSYIGKSRDRRIGIEVAMDQVSKFKQYLE